MATIIYMISQPMGGLSENEIMAVRGTIEDYMHEMFPGHAMVLKDTYFGQLEAPEGANSGIFALGESIKAMADVDMIVFAPGWEKARGCLVENLVANAYGKQTLVYSSEQAKTKES